MANPAQPPPYTCTVNEEGIYHWCWDDTAEIVADVLRPNRRGQYDVTTLYEGRIRSRGTLDLLQLRDQEELHRLSSFLDGSVNWLQRTVQITGDLLQARADEQACWPAPQPLPVGLLPVPALPVDLIPEPLRPWLADMAERLQVPLEYPTVPALVALAAVVATRSASGPRLVIAGR